MWVRVREPVGLSPPQSRETNPHGAGAFWRAVSVFIGLIPCYYYYYGR